MNGTTSRVGRTKVVRTNAVAAANQFNGKPSDIETRSQESTAVPAPRGFAGYGLRRQVICQKTF